MTEGIVELKPEQDPPQVPMDYTWAKQLGLVRKPAEFVTSISDERGEELLYAGMPISKAFEVREAGGAGARTRWGVADGQPVPCLRSRVTLFACVFVCLLA